MRRGPLRVAVGVMAYNEEANITRLLDSIVKQDAAERVARIVVVASGCTDRTCELVQAYRARDPRVELVVEPIRGGKIAAINTFLRVVDDPIVVVSCADLMFESGALRALLAPFDDPRVGMTGAHPIPLNGKSDFVGFAVNLMWDLHDRVSAVAPKMGELVAFRKLFDGLNTAALCDELSIERKIRELGFEVAYAGGARIRNQGPSTLPELVRQRVRWNAANFQIISDHAVEVATMNPRRVLRAAVEYCRDERPRPAWLLGAAALEAFCRARAFCDYFIMRRHRRHRVWVPLSSTKALLGLEAA